MTLLRFSLIASIIGFSILLNKNTHNSVEYLTSTKVGKTKESVIVTDNNYKRHETRVRFPEFTIVINDFKGYEYYNEKIATNYLNEVYYDTAFVCFYCDDPLSTPVNFKKEFKNARLNNNEKYFKNTDGSTSYEIKENYFETLIAQKDTLQLTETIYVNNYEDRVDDKNLLIDIYPKRKSDRFEVSYCYLTSLNDRTNLVRKKKKKNVKVEPLKIDLSKFKQTRYVSIKDSSNSFRLNMLKREKDRVSYKYTNLRMSKKYYQEHLNIVKSQCNLRDTLVTINGGECANGYFTLTDGYRIFDYSINSYFIRINRYRDNKLVATKYIVINVPWRC